MTILINGKEAALKKGVSFDFISENSFFTGADAYTLSITFPLKGCPQNRDIFGYIDRKDADLNTLLLDCEIHDRNFHAVGSVNIVEINELEVKTQFLQGRSVRNFATPLDKTYINEIPMPSVQVKATEEPRYYLASYESQLDRAKRDFDYFGFVCLPWVNNTSGNIQNPLHAMDPGRDYIWDRYQSTLVGQPFFLDILKRILDATDYRYDISAIENSYWKYLIICNALPAAWNIPARNAVLPHWTITEFLDEVECFLGGEFVVDDQARSIKFSFNASRLATSPVVSIDKVIDSHKVEITDKEEAQNTFFEQQNLAYADGGHQLAKFYSCPWVFSKMNIVRWNNLYTMRTTLQPYLEKVGTFDSSYYKCIHYCTPDDTYFVIRAMRTYQNSKKQTVHVQRLQVINNFGPRIHPDYKDAEVREMKIVPACIDETTLALGDMIFVDCGDLGDDTGADSDENQTISVNIINNGDSKREEFFDKLYVAFWPDNIFYYYPSAPHPFVDSVEVLPDNTSKYNPYNLRLTSKEAFNYRQTQHEVDASVKYTFSFLSDTIPDVHSIFYIHGKKYLAEKITATFTESGMQQLLKMTAYRMSDIRID